MTNKNYKIQKDKGLAKLLKCDLDTYKKKFKGVKNESKNRQAD